MKIDVVSLDGEKTSFSLSKRIDVKNPSKLHVKATELILSKYPMLTLYEEIPIYVKKGQRCIFDIFISKFGVFVEVQGAQHDKFNKFFHKSMRAFAEAKKRDEMKAAWCKLNNFDLIYFNHNENEEEWKAKI